MTAVQQYWIVENDINLVSNLTPVPVADEDALKATAVTLSEFLTDSTPLDGFSGTTSLDSLVIVTLSVPEYDNPFDTADRFKGGPSLSAVSIVTAQQSYSNPYDSQDKFKGGVSVVNSLTVTTVVVTYDNLYDTADKFKGAPSFGGVVIT